MIRTPSLCFSWMTHCDAVPLWTTVMGTLLALLWEVQNTWPSVSLGDTCKLLALSQVLELSNHSCISTHCRRVQLTNGHLLFFACPSSDLILCASALLAPSGDIIEVTSSISNALQICICAFVISILWFCALSSPACFR